MGTTASQHTAGRRMKPHYFSTKHHCCIAVQMADTYAQFFVIGSQYDASLLFEVKLHSCLVVFRFFGAQSWLVEGLVLKASRRKQRWKDVRQLNVAADLVDMCILAITVDPPPPRANRSKCSETTDAGKDSRM